jgi:uncharacterized protein (DUF1697 family)
VGGHVIKMDKLRELFRAVKFANVETFIASGNVIFETKSAADEKLEQKIEKHLEKNIGYEVGTFVRSLDEVKAISVYRPFSDEMMKAATVVSVAMIRSPISAKTIAEVKAFNSEVDDFHVYGREVYWLCRIRTSDSKFPAKKFEKLVGGAATWRNMNTMVRLAEKYGREI